MGARAGSGQEGGTAKAVCSERLCPRVGRGRRPRVKGRSLRARRGCERHARLLFRRPGREESSRTGVWPGCAPPWARGESCGARGDTLPHRLSARLSRPLLERTVHVYHEISSAVCVFTSLRPPSNTCPLSIRALKRMQIRREGDGRRPRGGRAGPVPWRSEPPHVPRRRGWPLGHSCQIASPVHALDPGFFPLFSPPK